MYRNHLKLIFDFVFSVIERLLLSSLILFVAAALFIVNSGKLSVIQFRPGKDGKIFKIIKFKTMNDKKGASGNLLSYAERAYSGGSVRQKNFTGRVPRLVSVITRNMSLVGIRSLLPSYLPLYNDFKRGNTIRSRDVTRWIQVNGRNAISWEKKLHTAVSASTI